MIQIFATKNVSLDTSNMFRFISTFPPRSALVVHRPGVEVRRSHVWIDSRDGLHGIQRTVSASAMVAGCDNIRSHLCNHRNSFCVLLCSLCVQLAGVACQTLCVSSVYIVSVCIHYDTSLCVVTPDKRAFICTTYNRKNILCVNNRCSRCTISLLELWYLNWLMPASELYCHRNCFHVHNSIRIMKIILVCIT